ncbi:MAG: hypothetical protein ACTSUO_09505 [Candidatus Thorarchaeota archaeon]
MPKSENEVEEIRRLIESMQSGLVEMFDQLRELKSRLDVVADMPPSENKSSVVPLFSKVELTTKTDGGSSTPAPNPDSTAPVDVPDAGVEPASPFTTSDEKLENDTSHSAPSIPSDEPHTSGSPLTEAKISRVLDPIAHELKTGEVPAEVVGEYLQAAKDELISESRPNNKVAHDIDVVLKFLRARGSRKIRDEERDNILRRIDRWRAYLTTH